MTITTKKLIAESRRENRTVTVYAESVAEFVELRDRLAVEGEDSAEVSGEGHSGPEGRGYLDIWGSDWRVSIIPPRGETITSMRGR